MQPFRNPSITAGGYFERIDVMRYAQNTSVSSERSKAEIERILTQYGANSFASGWQNDQAVIQFHMSERRIKFVLPLPSKQAKEFTHSKRGPRGESEAYRLWEQATRQRWRALALAIKAKMEAVECGISEFEDEFMSNIVMPDGKTVAEHARPMIAAAYKSGKVTALLPGW
jgi:hypothetical protein